MIHNTIRRVSLLVLILATVLVAPALAQYEKGVAFTFNRPITLPGVTLPAGQYLFRVVDISTGRRIIQVASADGHKAYALLFSIPRERVSVSDHAEIDRKSTRLN